MTHALGGEGYLNFEGNEFGHPEVHCPVTFACLTDTEDVGSGLIFPEKETTTLSSMLGGSGTL